MIILMHDQKSAVTDRKKANVHFHSFSSKFKMFQNYLLQNCLMRGQKLMQFEL